MSSDLRTYGLCKPPQLFIVKGNPTPLQRARHSNKRVYDPQKNAKKIFGFQIRQQLGDQELLTGPLKMVITFYMPIPHYKRKKIHECGTDPHFCKPDLSNLIKFVEDVCTGIIYKDDSLITECHAFKFYYHTPQTEFHFVEILKEAEIMKKLSERA